MSALNKKSNKLESILNLEIHPIDKPEFRSKCKSMLDKDGVLVLNEFLSVESCLLYTSPSPRDRQKSRMPSSA